MLNNSLINYHFFLDELCNDLDVLNKFYESILIETKAVKIYFLVRGRNAWYGTWVKHYTLGESFFKRLDEAKEYAEKMRKQGNVFYIEELPAILFCLENNFNILLTHINNNKPLKYINDIDILTKEKIYGKDLKILIDYLWKKENFTENSIIIEKYQNCEFERLKTTPLKLWKSFSIGTDYYLRWKEEKNKISHYYIHKVVKCIKKLNKYGN